MADPVVQTDAVEQHVGGLATQFSGEDPAVVGEDLLGDPIGVERFHERVAHRTRGRSCHDLGDDTEAGMVIHARDDREGQDRS